MIVGSTTGVDGDDELPPHATSVAAMVDAKKQVAID
jgi:hypothetical protein